MSLFAMRAATVLPSRLSSTSCTSIRAGFRPFSTTQTSCSHGTESTPSAKQRAQDLGSPDTKPKKTEESAQTTKKKTMAELDDELRLKMEGMSGGGGSAGVEYENGKAEGLKRGVKDNMFRVI